MKYTAGQAAQAAGISTPTITRAIKSGKISATKDHTGAWQIEPAELHRVYQIESHLKDYATHVQSDVIPLKDNALHVELEALRARLEGAEAAIIHKDEIISNKDALIAAQLNEIQYLRGHLDTEAAERRRTQAILTDQRAKAQRRSWWPWQKD